jgi:hypothetical protein
VSSITDEVTGFFNSPNPPSRSVALGSIQPLTQMSTRNFPGGKGRPVHKTENLTAICEPIVWKMWEPRYLTTLWVSVALLLSGRSFRLNEMGVKHDMKSYLLSGVNCTHLNAESWDEQPLKRRHLRRLTLPSQKSESEHFMAALCFILVS